MERKLKEVKLDSAKRFQSYTIERSITFNWSN